MADGAERGGAAFHDDVQKLAHEPLLQFNQGARVGQADQLLRGPQVGLHDALDETCHVLLHFLQAAVGGGGSTISVRTVARVLGPVQQAGTAFLELLAAFTAAEPAVALGRALRPSQPLNCNSPHSRSPPLVSRPPPQPARYSTAGASTDITRGGPAGEHLLRIGIDVASHRAQQGLVIEGRRVINGSFNFTRSADTRNAENVVLLDSPEVAGWFAANWEARRAVSPQFEAE